MFVKNTAHRPQALSFYYWYFYAPTDRDRSLVLTAFGLFATVTVLIFLGAFDFLYHWYTPQAQWGSTTIDYGTIGQSLAPWSNNNQLWYHGVVAYAFGQALHYFIWLKAIPDFHNKNPIPTSFRQSWRHFQTDFGRPLAAVIALVVLAGFGIWGMYSLPQARAVYFAIAAAHGYMEISAIGLVALAKRRP